MIFLALQTRGIKKNTNPFLMPLVCGTKKTRSTQLTAHARKHLVKPVALLTTSGKVQEVESVNSALCYPVRCKKLYAQEEEKELFS